jgi:NAD(P)-dependent dehydrogenase (short-subunit alcohol dehydrogenase family)
VTGRTALVTGAGNGLGRCISLRLATLGARVVLVGRTRAKLEDVEREISAFGGFARVEVADISVADDVSRLAAALNDETISILVNNGGIGEPVANLVDIEPDEWDEVFAINVRGVFLVSRAFLPPMLERETGDVINIASVSGKRPLAGRTPYVSSKMAVIGLTSTLAFEVGQRGVNVNSLSPGPLRGPRMERNFRLDAQRTGRSIEESERELVSRSALQRLVEEDEVADAVVAMLHMPGLCGADIDLSAGMVAR